MAGSTLYPGSLERGAHHQAHRRLIVNHENRLAAAARRDVSWPLVAGAADDRRHWQIESRTRAARVARSTPDLAAVAADDRQRSREAEAGALAGFLGGEERIENLVEQVARNAGAGVVAPESPRSRRAALRAGRDALQRVTAAAGIASRAFTHRLSSTW